MGWWKADPIPELQPPSPSRASPSTANPSLPDSASACPVDPQTRAIWLRQAQSQSKSPELPPSHPTISTPRPTATSFGASQECSSDRIDESPLSRSGVIPPSTLSHERQTSSIPRATPSTPLSTATPANSESETGTSRSGNWIYPSESQFFHAVMRKQTSSNPADLASSISHIIPIHNAVNERAWSLIKSWEGNSSAACGGPKLLSFRGLGAGALSPKARLKSIWGYTEPFDRHDWVVERCGGQQVEYVIDFYQGKSDESRPNGLNFYLDVRPKLNSFEGWKMRTERLVGMR